MKRLLILPAIAAAYLAGVAVGFAIHTANLARHGKPQPVPAIRTPAPRRG